MSKDPNIGSDKYIPDRKRYYRAQVVFWIVTAVWVTVLVAAIRFYETISGWLLALIVVLLAVTTPSLKELVQSYRKYRDEEEQFRKKR